jgi:quercetin dioxygenase-like cupin family protein
MRLFRFDASVGRPIDQFGSTQLMLSPIARTTGQVQIVCMHIGPAGLVGFHQADPAQLFLVVAGEGWVRSETPEQVPIQAGQAAFWESGEWHESGSDTGMTAIVIEGQTLDPGQLMPEKLLG